MGRKKNPGLIKRSGVWHVDKQINGRRICQSTRTTELEEAERFLARLIEESRQATIYGVRPNRSFEQAAAKFVLENQHKRSIREDIIRLKQLIPWIGDTLLSRLHIGVLQPWIEHRRKEGVAVGTINHGLKVVRRILNLAASEWMDEYGMTWLQAAPKIKLLPDINQRQPYPLNWEEQTALFKELPDHLAQMALFTVNTGCRDAEVCNLRWDWEMKLPQLSSSIFLVPGQMVKNGDERLVILNRISFSVVEAQRGAHPTHVFHYKGKPLKNMLTSAWKRARERAGLPQVRVHDLKHTFGRRLRAAGIGFEDRQDLLGHRSGRITTHYSAAELTKLIEAAESICNRGEGKPELVVLRRLNLA
ncbi:tyrosine-type recombinase/integrase [Sedimenticola selenatireducens]|uniref:tyrosine-type recombinase/integrase n=1 Tax=Sedimenticola selenatireducens TaxID=191960 RepID=UPI0004B05347|nr:site-specific integrase [Sedimenticola selenatireducens]